MLIYANMCKYANVPIYKYAIMPIYQYANIPICQYTNMPIYQYHARITAANKAYNYFAFNMFSMRFT